MYPCVKMRQYGTTSMTSAPVAETPNYSSNFGHHGKCHFMSPHERWVYVAGARIGYIFII